jgi:hypothetical protein
MKRKHLISILAVIVLSAFWYGYNVYNAGPRNLDDENAELVISAEELLQAYQLDEVLANGLYLDKVISIEGIISVIDKEGVSTLTLETGDIMSAVVCEMASSSELVGLELGQKVKVKGQCTGFLSDVIVVKCIIE